MAPLSKIAGASLLASVALAAPAHQAKRDGTFVSGGVLYSTSTETYTIYETPTPTPEEASPSPWISATPEVPSWTPTPSPVNTPEESPEYTPETPTTPTTPAEPTTPHLPALPTTWSAPSLPTSWGLPSISLPTPTQETETPGATPTQSSSPGGIGGIGQWFSNVDLTFYDTNGETSCGKTVDGTKVDIIAMAINQMGPASNNNPFCGKKVEIEYNGKSATAEVVDKCAGCVSFHSPLSIRFRAFLFLLKKFNLLTIPTQQSGNSIDLSRALFQKFSNFGSGRLTGAKWKFVD